MGTRTLATLTEHSAQVTPPPLPDQPPPERSAVRVKTSLQRAQDRAAELVGRTIAQRYRIDKLLAMGGMGAVYVGHHRLLKKRVAIKMLHPDTEGLPGLVTRFEREAIAGAHIVHPHVAAATDFGQLVDGSYFLVLEYVAGRTVHDLLGQGRVAPARAVHLARQIASALGAAHAMGIVHRDVKPANIMLVAGQDDFIKLIDFGFAKVPVNEVVRPTSARADGDLDAPLSVRLTFEPNEPGGNVTAVGVVFGTIEYMAPEAALGMSAVGPPADLYALGIILYELLTGRHPFDETKPAELFAQQRFTPPPPFAVSAPGAEVPPALEAIVMRLLEKDPRARFETSDALIEALDALGLYVPAPSGTRTMPPPALGASVPPAATLRARWRLPVLLALTVLMVTAATVGLYRATHLDGGAATPAPSAEVSPTPPPSALP